MDFKDVISDQLINGFETDISTGEILVTMLVTFLIGLYLFIVYRLITENAFYSKNYNIAMVAMSLVTAGIIMAMQSSLVISLGMVGALSIVRFRTAIKEPMDLLFLFWSIGTGIMCGAGLYKVAVITALLVTLAIVVLKFIPERTAGHLLFVGAENVTDDTEQAIIDAVKNNSKFYHLKSRNLGINTADYVFEVKVKDEGALTASLKAVQNVVNLSLVSHDGEFRG